MKYLTFFLVLLLVSKFRVGKHTNNANTHSRPKIVKNCEVFHSVWDKKLLLASKAKLKSFRLQRIFIRQGMSKEESLAASAKRRVAIPTHPISNSEPVSIYKCPNSTHPLLSPSLLQDVQGSASQMN